MPANIQIDVISHNLQKKLHWLSSMECYIFWIVIVAMHGVLPIKKLHHVLDTFILFHQMMHGFGCWREQPTAASAE